MALNFTVSFTFSPSTTISSSQVNTNTSDVANVFTGLEALTKTFAKLKVDVDPSTALEVATKQYADHGSAYRRPVLQFGSVTTVSVQSGLDGTSGDIPILFPDNTVRTETSTTRTTFDITRNAVLVTSGAQSGLTGATSEAINTWYALYAAKITDSSTTWVTVGSTVVPIQANFSTLNAAYGTNGWVYLGMIRNGDNSGATGDILNFVQAGNTTLFINTATGQVFNSAGFPMVQTASATSLTYTYSSGTGSGNLPANISHVYWRFQVGSSGGAGTQQYSNSAGTRIYGTWYVSSSTHGSTYLAVASEGSKVSTLTAASEIGILGFIDGVLGVGSNPLL